MASLKDRFDKPIIKLHVIISDEDDEWVAHCLEMDLVATNTTEKKVEDDIIDLIKAQFIYAMENDNFENLLKSAPPEEWAKLKIAKSCSSKLIRIQHKKKKSLSQNPPINEVELCIA